MITLKSHYNCQSNLKLSRITEGKEEYNCVTIVQKKVP